jgi:hypothetical protein
VLCTPYFLSNRKGLNIAQDHICVGIPTTVKAAKTDGIGREPFANAQRFSNHRYNYICSKISHANAKDFIIRPKYSDNMLTE